VFAARLLLISGFLTLVLLACSSSPDPTLLAAGTDDDSLIAGGEEAAVLQVTPTVPTVPVPETTPSTVVEGLLADPVYVDVPLVIFDTDMGPDVDDVLALAMLHSYEKQGLIELAAVTVSRESEAGAKYSDAINTFYGRPDIPIGMYYGETTYFDDRLNYVSEADSWPNDVATTPIGQGYKVQRKVLSEARALGRDVLIIQTGFSGNVAELVSSQPDEFSPLNGRDLVAETVSLLSVMAGSFDLGIVEFNVEHDISSAQELFSQWPGRIAVSPFELGNAIHYPYSSITSDFGWTDRHPVREAYEFRDLDWHADAPPFYNMRSWDLTSVIEAVEPGANYFLRSEAGTVNVDGSGRTYFDQGQGRHYLLDRASQYSSEQRQRVIDRMIELTADQP
jgi:inosine-uridine nucleoside N-ribohydrolase